MYNLILLLAIYICFCILIWLCSYILSLNVISRCTISSYRTGIKYSGEFNKRRFRCLFRMVSDLICYLYTLILYTQIFWLTLDSLSLFLFSSLCNKISKINANPYVHEIQWFFNGNLLASNYNGILIANHSLGKYI